MRVLHLIDARGPGPSSVRAAMLADALPASAQHGHSILALGGGALTRAARDAGWLPQAEVVHAPMGLGLCSITAALARVRALGRIDIIHAWSLGAATLASLLRPSTPCVLTLAHQPAPPALRWLRALVEHRADSHARLLILPVCNTLRRSLAAAGIDPSHAPTLRPAVPQGRVAFHARAELRTRWKLAEHDRLIALLLDDPAGLHVHRIMVVLGLLHEALGQSTRLRLLVHPSTPGRRRWSRLTRTMNRHDALLVDDAAARPWDVLPACDAAIAPAPPASPANPESPTTPAAASLHAPPRLDSAAALSLLWAMAANVPVVAHATYAHSEILEDRHSALLAHPDRPVHMARQLLRILEDRELAWRLRDTARHECYSLFSPSAHTAALRAVYQQLLSGAPSVQVPPIPATGGLRFAGRA